MQQHRTDLTGKWADLAKDSFPERIPKQLRERWIFELAPEIKKGMWTPEEEELLIARHKVVKNKWAEIAKVRALRICPQQVGNDFVVVLRLSGVLLSSVTLVMWQPSGQYHL